MSDGYLPPGCTDRDVDEAAPEDEPWESCWGCTVEFPLDELDDRGLCYDCWLDCEWDADPEY